MTAGVIRKLHKYAQGISTLSGGGDAGEWKKHNNEIIEILPGGDRRVRFVPAAAKDTPGLIDDLCRSYREACENERVPALLLAATFVFDFLCIHPFRDGNGRVSRLITTLLLQSHGFIVARFISLERLVEEARQDYYRVLGVCSRHWEEGRNEILPWWNYFLTIVRRGYAEFAEKAEQSLPRGGKSD